MAGKKERIEIARDALESSRRAALRMGEQAGGKETKKLLEKAAKDLRERLDVLSTRGLDESFTAVQLRAALMQVQAVLGPLVRGMKGVIIDSAAFSAEQAASHAIDYMQTAERAFRGVSQPLAIDPARMLSKATQGANASVLRRLALGPEGTPAKRGVLERYGLATIEQFEKVMQVGLVAKKSWRDVREDLTDESPFLQGAPASWATRIVRSETMGAYARGAVETIKEANAQLSDMVKILSATFDERTGSDSFCQHGQIRRPHEPFESWYGLYDAPPNRPNDREVVTPHRIAWPIPPYLQWKDEDQIAARWEWEGRKGAPPERPEMTTVPLEQFGR